MIIVVRVELINVLLLFGVVLVIIRMLFFVFIIVKCRLVCSVCMVFIVEFVGLFIVRKGIFLV